MQRSWIEDPQNARIVRLKCEQPIVVRVLDDPSNNGCRYRSPHLIDQALESACARATVTRNTTVSEAPIAVRRIPIALESTRARQSRNGCYDGPGDLRVDRDTTGGAHAGRLSLQTTWLSSHVVTSFRENRHTPRILYAFGPVPVASMRSTVPSETSRNLARLRFPNIRPPRDLSRLTRIMM